MSDINLTVKKIIQNLEENIKDKECLEVAKTEIFNLYNAFADELTELNTTMNSRILELAQSQKESNDKMTKIEKSLKKIENDIYLDEEDEDGEYTMEIVCPYCNKDFSVDIDEVADRDEIICPECKNTIELDWGKECDCGECDDDCNCDNCNDCGDCDGNCHTDEDDNL